MTRVKILVSHVVVAGVVSSVGDVYDMDDEDARRLAALGFVGIVTAPPASSAPMPATQCMEPPRIADP